MEDSSISIGVRKEAPLIGTTKAISHGEPELRTEIVDDEAPSSSTAQDSSTKLAGITLVKMATRDLAQIGEVLFEDEKDVLEDCFARGQAGRDFAKYYIEAIRAGVRSSNDDFVRFLLEKDPSHQLLKDDIEILLIAVRGYGDC